MPGLSGSSESPGTALRVARPSRAAPWRGSRTHVRALVACRTVCLQGRRAYMLGMYDGDEVLPPRAGAGARSDHTRIAEEISATAHTHVHAHEPVPLPDSCVAGALHTPSVMPDQHTTKVNHHQQSAATHGMKHVYNSPCQSLSSLLPPCATHSTFPSGRQTQVPCDQGHPIRGPCILFPNRMSSPLLQASFSPLACTEHGVAA